MWKFYFFPFCLTFLSSPTFFPLSSCFNHPVKASIFDCMLFFDIVNLFSITQRQTNTTTNFIVSDVSAYTDRYNKFSVTEGSTFEVYSGEFLYKVYAQTSPTNLDPSLSDELVEEGILKVNPISASDVFYTPN